MKIQILTIFPDMLHGFLASSIIGRAARSGKVDIEALDLRRWARGRHRTTDDAPYGGGPGMVMKVEPIAAALDELRQPSTHVILTSPAGKPFRQSDAERLARLPHIIILCGHYEGVDQRVSDHLVDEELSLGDFILTNGALAAAVLADATVRLLPGVLGDASSALGESFSTGLLDHPHYTRPEEFRGWKVPPVLLSGDHQAIAEWRRLQALELTAWRRPDLLPSPVNPPSQT